MLLQDSIPASSVIPLLFSITDVARIGVGATGDHSSEVASRSLKFVIVNNYSSLIADDKFFHCQNIEYFSDLLDIAFLDYKFLIEGEYFG